MIDLPIGIALPRATFPDWRIVDDGERCLAVRRHVESVAACPPRFAAAGRHVLTARTPADLATRLAARECPLGITPASQERCKDSSRQGRVPVRALDPRPCRGVVHAFGEPFPSTAPFFIMKRD